MSLVRISSRSERPPGHPIRRMVSLLLIDKFFLLGAAGGLVGTLGLGLWLWLARSGLMPLPASYAVLRELHGVLQFYLFLAPFILGFILQSAPRLLEVSQELPRVSRLALPGTVIAALLLAVEPRSLPARMVIAVSIWGVALALVPALRAAAWPARLRFGGFAFAGLVALGGGVFTDLTLPVNGVLLFWAAVVPIILSTAQQFIAGALGGRRPTPAASVLTLVSWLSAMALLVSGRTADGRWQAAAVPAILSLLLFLHSTGASGVLSRLREPLALAFAVAHVWALTGAALLAGGARYADAVLHLWGTGYAVTLIIGVSLRLVGWLADEKPLSDRVAVILLLLWQLVPIGRGLEPSSGSGMLLILPAGTAAGLVLVTWAGALGRSILGLVYRQIQTIYRANHR